MKKSKKSVKNLLIAISYIFAVALGGFIIVFINKIYDWWPLGGSFDFPTLGIYIGSVGTVASVIIVGIIAERELKQQTKIQKQNVAIQLIDKRSELYDYLSLLLSNFSDLSFEMMSLDKFEGNYNIEFPSSKIAEVGSFFNNSCESKVSELLNNFKELKSNITKAYKIVNAGTFGVTGLVTLNNKTLAIVRNEISNEDKADFDVFLRRNHTIHYDKYSVTATENCNLYDIREEINELYNRTKQTGEQLLEEMKNEMEIS